MFSSDILCFVAPNRFSNTNDMEASIKFAKEVMEQINNYFHWSNAVGELEMNDINTWKNRSRCYFSVPILDVTFHLFDGLWIIYPGRYESVCSYFDISADGLGYYRGLCFDAMRIIGLDEGWVCSREVSRGSNNFYRTMGFDQWLKLECRPVEFKLSQHIDGPKKVIPGPKYHDSFWEYKDWLYKYEQDLMGYEVLCVTPICGCMLLGREGKTYLYSIKERCLLIEDPIDGIAMVGCAMVVKKGRDSALFSSNGVQLSEFKKSCFVYDDIYDKPSVTEEISHKVYSYSEMIKE